MMPLRARSGFSKRAQGERRRSRRWPAALLGAAILLAAYYAVAMGSLRSQDSNGVDLGDAAAGSGGAAERLTIDVEVVDLDTGTGALDIQLRPAPLGDFVGDRDGQLAEPLQLEVSPPGGPVTGFDFPANQIIDPVAASLPAETPAFGFPFDRPHAGFHLRALIRDRPVPIDVELLNETDGWRLLGGARANSQELHVEVEARRELLSITFSVIYIATVVVVAVTTVAVIGNAIARRKVSFDQLIWLVAMLAVIPAVRNEMPGVPPIGTAVDLFILLPSVFIIIVALLAAVVVVAVDEAAAV